MSFGPSLQLPKISPPAAAAADISSSSSAFGISSGGEGLHLNLTSTSSTRGCIKITLTMPKSAGLRLQKLAQSRHPSLTELGIVAVDIIDEAKVSVSIRQNQSEADAATSTRGDRSTMAARPVIRSRCEEQEQRGSMLTPRQTLDYSLLGSISTSAAATAVVQPLPHISPVVATSRNHILLSAAASSGGVPPTSHSLIDHRSYFSHPSPASANQLPFELPQSAAPSILQNPASSSVGAALNIPYYEHEPAPLSGGGTSSDQLLHTAHHLPPTHPHHHHHHQQQQHQHPMSQASPLLQPVINRNLPDSSSYDRLRFESHFSHPPPSAPSSITSPVVRFHHHSNNNISSLPPPPGSAGTTGSAPSLSNFDPPSSFLSLPSSSSAAAFTPSSSFPPHPSSVSALVASRPETIPTASFYSNLPSTSALAPATAAVNQIPTCSSLYPSSVSNTVNSSSNLFDSLRSSDLLKLPSPDIQTSSRPRPDDKATSATKNGATKRKRPTKLKLSIPPMSLLPTDESSKSTTNSTTSATSGRTKHISDKKERSKKKRQNLLATSQNVLSTDVQLAGNNDMSRVNGATSDYDQTYLDGLASATSEAPTSLSHSYGALTSSQSQYPSSGMNRLQ